jgi:hypothetical protein
VRHFGWNDGSRSAPIIFPAEGSAVSFVTNDETAPIGSPIKVAVAELDRAGHPGAQQQETSLTSPAGKHPLVQRDWRHGIQAANVDRKRRLVAGTSDLFRASLICVVRLDRSVGQARPLTRGGTTT